jgi:hypothetical protein
MPIPLSGYSLSALGWRKNGLTWEKGLHTVSFDGCDWLYFDFPKCIKDENYSIEGLKIVPTKVQYVHEINDTK